MPEFNLDQFKKSWQQQEVKPKYDTVEIESMLNKSSRNYVKYILWISVAEFLVILGLNIYYLFGGNESTSFMDILSKLGVKNSVNLKQEFENLYLSLKILSLGLTALFVVLFYKNYVQIKVELNLKKLILQIMKFKKTVRLFILANIGLMIVYTVVLSIFTFWLLSQQNIKLDHPTLIGFFVGLVIMMLISVVLIWIYYRIVYGIILQKLGRNLQELQKIEEDQI